jgi:hypothetical protein
MRKSNGPPINSELLDAAIGMLGTLTPDETKAAKLILTSTDNVSVENWIKYRQTKKIFLDIEDAARRLEERLRKVDQRLELTLPVARKLMSSLSGLEHHAVEDKLTGEWDEEATRAIQLKTIDAVRLIISRAKDATTTLNTYQVRGGAHTFRAKFQKSNKESHVQRCVEVWFLSGRSLDRGARKKLLEFVYLVYEALTGEHEGKGLRDLVAKGQQAILRNYAPLDNYPILERIISRIEVLEEFLGLLDQNGWEADEYALAELTLLRRYKAFGTPEPNAN